MYVTISIYIYIINHNTVRNRYIRISLPCNTVVKNGWSCTYTSLYAIMTCSGTTLYLIINYVTPNTKETPYICTANNNCKTTVYI